jgi:hypothetical protein
MKTESNKTAGSRPAATLTLKDQRQALDDFFGIHSVEEEEERGNGPIDEDFMRERFLDFLERLEKDEAGKACPLPLFENFFFDMQDYCIPYGEDGDRDHDRIRWVNTILEDRVLPQYNIPFPGGGTGAVLKGNTSKHADLLLLPQVRQAAESIIRHMGRDREYGSPDELGYPLYEDPLEHWIIKYPA